MGGKSFGKYTRHAQATYLAEKSSRQGNEVFSCGGGRR